MTTSIPTPAPPPYTPPPPILRSKTLLKQKSWSPELDYKESWQRRKSLSLDRRNRRSISVTDEDIDELRGFLDLGIVFGDECPDDGNCSKKLSEALPALDLYLALRRSFRGSVAGESSSASDSISSPDVSPAESPLSMFAISPSESQEARQAGIKRWARLVALAARDSY
ncbi:uncharacterized protein LOC110021533 [Phalaenopsis equestris]|uniref:uncharacterized protein LOC110021533 n=1 Tax=Phalaenopsis equestris TaxID=78828 RepID=UPI0009E31D28|nr:uncharacterized protein LOC110021533 [Phalaenopsis equestris]